MFKPVSSKAPIALFVYNRPIHTAQVIEALTENYGASESSLFVFSDAAKSREAEGGVQEVRKIISNIKGFKKVEVVARERNMGLAHSVITGVSALLAQYRTAIVLEDDLVTSRMFLSFMNQALERYEVESKIMSVSGYNLPLSTTGRLQSDSDIFLNPRPMSWGWATWANRWVLADWAMQDYEDFACNWNKQARFNKGGVDLTPMLRMQKEGKIDSWYIRWCYTHYKNAGLCVYPLKSFVKNIGHDSTGVHCSFDEKGVYTHVALEPQNSKFDFSSKIEIDENTIKQFRRGFGGEWYRPRNLARTWKSRILDLFERSVSEKK